jgi:hypothetical protein
MKSDPQDGGCGAQLKLQQQLPLYVRTMIVQSFTTRGCAPVLMNEQLASIATRKGESR